jgi:quinoprotein glucose dehydrogenase
VNRLAPLALVLLALACSPAFVDRGTVGPAAPRRASEWPSYGNDPGGSRYSPLAAISRENVGRLEVAWTHHTGDLSDGSGPVRSTTAFENTPLLVDGTLFVCSPFNRVTALDPVTGAVRWSYDPRVPLDGRYANQLVCRGVSTWLDAAAPPGAPCRRRILTATNDARLLALDAATGALCESFGAEGSVDLNPAAGEQRWRGEYQVTSPPAVAGDVVVVGSAIGDNQRWNAPSGVIRGFDVRTGAERWAFDLAPPGFRRTTENTSAAGHALGTPNAWGPFAVDEARGLVFAPTGNPMLDYYRGQNREMDHYGSSVVALRAATGEVAWSFQTVHHDVWDYDVPAQPVLATLRRDGREVPAVVQTTKMGLLFVLHRDTGAPLFPIEERPVPTDGVPGETLSPTQPFPTRPPPLSRQALSADDAWGIAFFDRRWCRRQLESMRHGAIYEPPSQGGTIVFPGNAGGSNWGGIALDPERRVVYANVMDLPFVVKLLPREEFARTERPNPRVELSPQEGTPYGLYREPFLSPLMLPCTKPPWGSLAAVDLERGEILWQRPVGTVEDLAPVPLRWELGTPNLGGPLATGGGLVFLGATMDHYLRAFDAETGAELWRGRLPAPGNATPMTYEAEGRQYVVVAAGGHARSGGKVSDALVAFGLPETR